MPVFQTQSEEETIALGERLAQRFRPGTVVALNGDLGTGKTRVIKGICKGLGVQQHVASPTFTLINEYRGHNGLPVYHFDFYRLNSIAEIRELGFDEYVNGIGVCLLEWAERAGDLLPRRRWNISLKLGATDDERTITIEEPMKETVS